MKEIYNGETVALGGPNMVTKELVVDEATGKKAKFTYDKTTGAIAVQDEVDEDSINPVTGRAVAKAIEEGGGGDSYTAGDGIAISEGEISAKVDGSTIGINADGELEAIGGGGSSVEIVNLQGTETAATIIGYIGAGKIIRRRATVTDTSTSKMTIVDYYLAQYFTAPWQEEVLLTAVYENAGELGVGTIKVSASQSGWETTWHAFS